MGTTADKLSYLNGTKTAIKNAIVSRGVPIPDGTAFRDYAEKIEEITDIPDLSNPGAESDLRNGKQLVGADGSVITGSLQEVEAATPSISVSSSGLITASVNQSSGIVSGGTKSATNQLATQGATTIMPGTTAKTAVASGRYTTGAVQVAGDSNLIPANIAEGKSIFGIIGSYVGEKTEVASGIITIDNGYAETYSLEVPCDFAPNVGLVTNITDDLWFTNYTYNNVFMSAYCKNGKWTSYGKRNGTIAAFNRKFHYVNEPLTFTHTGSKMIFTDPNEDILFLNGEYFYIFAKI